jgi:hypothetical protein
LRQCRQAKSAQGKQKTFEVKQQYRKMKTILDRHPESVDNAVEGIRRAGMVPVRGSILLISAVKVWRHS